MLHCKTNKSQSLYNGESMVVSLAQNTKGNGFLSGHDDGIVVRYFIIDEEQERETSGQIVQHPVSPCALAWLQGAIAVAGCDRKIIFYDSQGRQIRNFDYGRSDIERDFTVAASSPNGQSVAFGSFDRIRIFSWSQKSVSWEENLVKDIENVYSLTSLIWRKDGVR